MDNYTVSRRKFLITATASTVALGIAPANAQNFLRSLRNFIFNNYDRSLRDLTEDGIRTLIRRVMPVAEELQRASSDLRQHFDEEWANASSYDGRPHTSRCPSCITVAQEVERRALGDLAPVPNRTPNCFLIGGSQFVSTNWGSLHRYQGGQIGPAEGRIWFSNGNYIGQDFHGRSLRAQPNC